MHLPDSVRVLVHKTSPQDSNGCMRKSIESITAGDRGSFGAGPALTPPAQAAASPRPLNLKDRAGCQSRCDRRRRHVRVTHDRLQVTVAPKTTSKAMPAALPGPRRLRARVGRRRPRVLLQHSAHFSAARRTAGLDSGPPPPRRPKLATARSLRPARRLGRKMLRSALSSPAGHRLRRGRFLPPPLTPHVTRTGDPDSGARPRPSARARVDKRGD